MERYLGRIKTDPKLIKEFLASKDYLNASPDLKNKYLEELGFGNPSHN